MKRIINSSRRSKQLIVLTLVLTAVAATSLWLSTKATAANSATISGQVFIDKNGNAVKEAGESGLSGWTVQIIDASNNVLASQSTDPNGNYSITLPPVPAGSITIKVREVVQTGWVQTTSNPADIVVTSTGGTFAGRDFGNFQKISISGQVFNDLNGNASRDAGDPALQGRTVFIDTTGNGALDNGEPFTATDVSGNYSFTNLGPGTYKVRMVVPAGGLQTTGNPADITAVSGTNVNGSINSGLNFGSFQTISISGQVYNDLNGNGVREPGDNGLQGWRVYLDTNANNFPDSNEPLLVTDAQGNYSFTGLGPGTYKVRLSGIADFTQTTTSPADIVASSGSSRTGVDFGAFLKFGFSGHFFEDINGNGVQDAGDPPLGNWTFFLDDNNNGILDNVELSEMSNATGAYSIGGFGPGIYRPREVGQANYIQTTAKVDIVASSGTNSTVNFGNFHTATISGQVFKDFNASGSIDTSEPGLSGWTVFLDLNNNGIVDAGETSVTTNAGGNYSFSNLGPGQVTVREVVQSGWSTTTNSSSSLITLTSGMNQTINFGDLQQFVVVNTNDSGPGSLRQAITDANATAGANVINITFSIPAAGVQTIAPISVLPNISHAVLIDGYSQPGTSENTLANSDNAVLLIEISGANIPNSSGLIVAAGGTTLKGLIVNRFSNAILFAGNAGTISGNWIGTDATGKAAAANLVGIAVGGSNNQIGGTTPAARNVISGNTGAGIGLNSGSSNVVQGNFIGTDITGTVALGNKNAGISIGASNNTVGGTTPGAGNLISGNGDGVLIANAGNLIQGNLIGTKADGTSPLGNLDDGLLISGSNNTIGGTASGAGNVIAFNSKAGAFVVASPSVPVGDSILSNSIFSNSGIGIDLSTNGNRGVTPNDPGDADTGPNNLQNFPQLVSANKNSSGLNVVGSLNSTASTSFRIEFFVNPTCDSSGNGEGQIFIGSTNVTTDTNGFAAINGNLTPGFDTLGKFVTSTATRLDAQGNPTDTSEFSACARVTVADLAMTGSALPNPVQSGDNLTYTFKIANNGPDAATSVAFSDQLPSSTTFVSCISSNGAGCSSTTAGNVTAGLGTILNGAQVTITITVKVDNTATGPLNDTATVASPVFDPSQPNNSVTINTAVTPVAIIQFGQPNYTVAERGGGIQITVVRTGDTSGAVSVDYATDDGSIPTIATPCSTVSGKASERCDYTRSAGTLSFAPGETQKSFLVLVNDDSYTEGAETLQLVLSNPAAGVLGPQSTATLQITDDSLESSGNPLDDPSFFIRQHYHDFLNREPDQSGLDFWTGNITSCGSDDGCRNVHRINDSAAFFLSIEFQQTGYLVERLYKVAYGDATGNSTFPTPHTLPVPIVRLREFLRDTQEIGQGVVVGAAGWEQLLETNKQAFTAVFVSRQRFTNAFPLSLNAQQFVTQLDQNAGQVLTDADKTQLMGIFGGASASSNDAAKRALILRQVADNSVLQQRESNRAFVLMQFFGYLRRNPDDAQDSDHTGFDFWLTKLNQFNGDFVQAEMVKAFITSAEYHQRFGP